MNFDMVPRHHGAIENDVIIGGATDTNHGLLIEGPALHRSLVERVEQREGNHITQSKTIPVGFNRNHRRAWRRLRDG